MNIAQAIKRHEDLAFWFARIGKAKRARAELLRIEQLKKLRELKRKNPTYRMFDDAVEQEMAS
jgi:hypothetical protein